MQPARSLASAEYLPRTLTTSPVMHSVPPPASRIQPPIMPPPTTSQLPNILSGLPNMHSQPKREMLDQAQTTTQPPPQTNQQSSQQPQPQTPQQTQVQTQTQKVEQPKPEGKPKVRHSLQSEQSLDDSIDPLQETTSSPKPEFNHARNYVKKIKVFRIAIPLLTLFRIDSRKTLQYTRCSWRFYIRIIKSNRAYKKYMTKLQLCLETTWIYWRR